MSLIDQLRNGDGLHRRAAVALEQFGPMSEFVLADTARALAFVQWQRANSSSHDSPGVPVAPPATG